MSNDLTLLGTDGIRRSYDEHYDTMMDVEQDPTGAFFAIQKQADRIEELEAKLVEYKMVAGAIDKRWAESEDEVAELQAKLAELEPKDGRPCATDEFLAVILDELDDNWDIFEAIKDWVEGDWVNAVQGTTLAELSSVSCANLNGENL
jgi:uncharacterized coiled-coil protein SlyX